MNKDARQEVWMLGGEKGTRQELWVPGRRKIYLAVCLIVWQEEIFPAGGKYELQ